MIGPSLAVGCAFIWSLSLIIFKRTGEHVSPVLLNLYKNCVGVLFMIPTLLLFNDQPFHPQTSDMILLVVSGFLGIGVADSLMLKCLKLIGASRFAIVECLYSPFIVVIAVVALGEQFTWQQGLGALAVIAAIMLVSETSSSEERISNHLGIGVALGTLGLLSMAIGIVMIKPLFTTVPLLWVVTIRLMAGVFAGVLNVAWLPNRKQLIRSLLTAQNQKERLLACFLSSYVAMIAWVAGFKYNDASIAAILNQTSTIFTVMLAVLILKEPLTQRQALGTGLAIVGVAAVIVAS